MINKLKKFIINCFLALVPCKRQRKILRHKWLGAALPCEWTEFRVRTSYGDKHVYLGQDGIDVVYEELCKPKPSLICRFGTLELGIVSQFINNKELRIKFENTQPMYDNAGFFPITDYHLSRFAGEMVEASKDIDVLGILHYQEEWDVISRYCQDARITEIQSISSISFENPWTRVLKGKKVLVIHPFAETIKKQYEKRKLLFENQEILPEFDLKIIKAVQSIADEKADLPFKTWFEALDYMKEQIRNTDFDIAIIGAGAYGMPLAHYCKTIGKKGVHMGGKIQLLFGIKGRRWDDLGIYNEHWVSPSADETPKGAEKVEGGCYWN